MITKIKWNNHEILGNLELDFTKADGSPYSTIILAGENGTGKTTILETLSTFLLASGEISHLLSGENDQSQSDRNNQCISFSFL